MIAWVVIDRRHDRQSLKSRLPRALGAKGPTPGLHLSGVQIEAPPQLWSGDPDMVGFGPSDLPTFPFWNSPRYPLSPLLSCTYVEPIFQPFCFQLHACNGLPHPLCHSHLHTFHRLSHSPPF